MSAWGLILAFLVLTGCQATIGGLHFWFFPTRSIAPRAVYVGDAEQVQVPAFTPKGNSMLISVRVNPKATEKRNPILSEARRLRETIRNKIKEADAR